MNFTAIRYFNEVARTKAIRRAAERLHVTPSAISRQLALLEHELGAPLLERTPVGVELTPAGVLLERYSRSLFRDLDRVKSGISAFRAIEQGEIKIHAMEGVLSNGLAQAIAAFRLRYSGIDFQVTTCASDAICEALMHDETDIGIIYNPELRFGVEVIAQRQEPVMCLLAPTDPMAGAQALSIQELCTRPLALPQSSFGLRQLFDRAAHARRLKPQVAMEANSLEFLRAMAVRGVCLTIGPEISARTEIDAGLLRAVTITESAFNNVRSAVCVHQERVPSYAAAAFLKQLRKDGYFAETLTVSDAVAV